MHNFSNNKQDRPQPTPHEQNTGTKETTPEQNKDNTFIYQYIEVLEIAGISRKRPWMAH